MSKSLCGKAFKFYQVLKSINKPMYIMISKCMDYTYAGLLLWCLTILIWIAPYTNIECFLNSQKLDGIIIILTIKNLKKHKN